MLFAVERFPGEEDLEAPGVVVRPGVEHVAVPEFHAPEIHRPNSEVLQDPPDARRVIYRLDIAKKRQAFRRRVHSA